MKFLLLFIYREEKGFQSSINIERVELEFRYVLDTTALVQLDHTHTLYLTWKLIKSSDKKKN